MEGVRPEAVSLAGHLRLGKLIVLYDDNHVSLAGPTDVTFTEDVARYDAYGWHAQHRCRPRQRRRDDRPAIAAAKTSPNARR